MQTKASISRRQFVQLAALAAVGAQIGMASRASENGSDRARRIPLGVQLYSVRAECKKNLSTSLRKISDIGYKGVEFAGYWGHSAKEIRKMLDDNGLVACGSHTPLEDVLADKLPASIEFNQIIGNHLIIIPDMAGTSRMEWVKHAEFFNQLASDLRPQNLSIGYHSHWHDFHPVEGEMPWDIFGKNTRAEVILQLDTSNCVDGGGNPLAELRKFPGRARSIHIKPNGGGPDAIITEDKIDWPPIFDCCEKGGTEWYIVEHETARDPFAAIAGTFVKLNQIGKA